MRQGYVPYTSIYESLLYIGKVVSLDEVRCFSVRNASTSEGYLHSLSVQPQNFFVVANRRSRFTGLVNLSFQMWRQERATRSTIDIFERRCSLFLSARCKD